MNQGCQTPQSEHHVGGWIGRESHVGETLYSGLVSKYRSDWCDGGSSGLGDRRAGTARERRALFPPSLCWLRHP